MARRPGETPIQTPFGHVKHVSLVHQTKDYIVYIDSDQEVNWETTQAYDDSLQANPRYDPSALSTVTDDAAIIEVKLQGDFSETRRRQIKRLLCEAIASALEFDYPGARRMIEEAETYVLAKDKDQPALSKRAWEGIAIFVFGVVFISLLLVLAIAFPIPTPFQYFVFRTVIALAAAGIAAFIPGLLDIDIPAVRAGGALAVLVLVYEFSPASLVAQVPPAPDPNPHPPPAIATTYRICAGEYEKNCLPHDVYQYCYLTAEQWAKARCESYKIQRLDVRGGNRCGYTLDEVICTSPK